MLQDFSIYCSIELADYKDKLSILHEDRFQAPQDTFIIILEVMYIYAKSYTLFCQCGPWTSVK